MKVKISATFEGKCTICGKESTVFTAGDEDTCRTVTVCKECADKLGAKPIEEVVEEYGKEDPESFKEGIKIDRKADAS
jgi:hypothetical protein